MMTTPMTLKLARSKLRAVMGDRCGWNVKRITNWLFLCSHPKELMECLVVEIQAQLRVDGELFECFPHHHAVQRPVHL